MSLKRADYNNIDFGSLVIAEAPAINSFAYPAGRSSINVNELAYIRVYGSNFIVGCTVRVADTVVSVVNYISSTELYFEAPYLPVGTHKLMVVNPTGQYAISMPGLIYTDYAVWVTPSGLLGTINESLNTFQLLSSGVTYSIYDGSLPPGYTLSSSGLISGTLTATPAVNQQWYFTVAVIDQYGSTTTRVFYLRFVSTPVTWITAGDDLPSFNEAPYIQGIVATSNSTVTYTLISGALPDGLTLSSNGLISGTPSPNATASTITLTYTFTIRATDQEGQFSDQNFSLTYVPTFPIWTTFSYVQGYLNGQPINLSFNAYSNSTVTYNVSSGVLPPGTSLNASTGLLSGTATATELQATYSFTIRATDQENHSSFQSHAISIFTTPIVATSTGTVTDGSGYRTHTFTSSGTFTVTQSGIAQVLIVAGGGGGGAGNGGGGGAGGIIYFSALNIAVGTYSITVGGGGAGATAMFAGAGYGSDGVCRPGSSGNNSTAFGYTAYGGGGGAAGYRSGSQQAISGLAAGQGGTGGSGGGSSLGTALAGGIGLQGFAGGAASAGAGSVFGGGGGGAGSAGQSGAGTGAGGNGTLDSDGNPVAGGGNGGDTSLAATTWGGGRGGTISFAFRNEGSAPGGNATRAGSGGGGGGTGAGGYAYYQYNAGGGAGATGMVVIKYLLG